ncbi:DUF4158 domain-containing protein [Polaromonas sp. P1-6]|nr:DUF4158 domain-containing protein [Polaromonas sp. P1-6]
MQGWQATYLGMRELPHEISDFEMKAFFTFDRAERKVIDARRGTAHKLGLALHIGFLRMSGRLLDAFRVVPVASAVAALGVALHYAEPFPELYCSASSSGLRAVFQWKRRCLRVGHPNFMQMDS